MGWAERGWPGLVQGLARVRPVERMSEHQVEVGQERFQFFFQVHHGGKVAAADDLPHDNAEHDFDLIQPRTVLGEIHEADAMRPVGQELTPRDL